MQQYIYGNIGHQAYRVVSSDQHFFADAQRATVLKHLLSYDRYCRHGELSVEEHQCFWMVTTDLDQPGDMERLYLQVSGGEFHRNGFYVQGYMSDEGDQDLYGPEMLRLLRTRFAPGKETLESAQKGDLRPLKWDALPADMDLQSARVDARLMRGILLALLENKRVIVRLPSVGRDAMRHSRELLLAIYERLPYEQRRVNGFFTGASATKMFDEDNALPAAVTIILMDADADITNITSGDRQVFFDCADPGFFPKTEKTPHAALVEFLAEQPVAVLEEYFQFCRSYIRDEMDGSSLKITDYRMLLDFFNVGRIEFTDERIRLWAANLLGGKWPPRLKHKLYDKIARTLSLSRLEEYLTQRFDSIQDLDTLGVLDKQELSGGNDTEPRDINGALTLRMTELLLPRYPEGSRAHLVQALSQRFVELGSEAWPCLLEEKPTSETVAEAKALSFSQAGAESLALVKEVKEQSCVILNEMRDRVLIRYEEKRKYQHTHGVRLIQDWHFEGINDTWSIRELYEHLKRHYLFEELCKEQVWNDLIAQKIHKMCMTSQMQTVEAYRSMQALEEASRKMLESYGGRFTDAQIWDLNDARNYWNYIQSLETQGCETLNRLLELFDEIENTKLTVKEKVKLKSRHALSLAQKKPDAEQIYQCAGLLREYAKYTEEKELLRVVVEESPDLAVIPGTLPPAQAYERLKILCDLSWVELFRSDVDFGPWGVHSSPGKLLDQIDVFRKYRRGKPEPTQKAPHIQDWILDLFEDHPDLDLLLAMKEPRLRVRLIPRLARKENAVSAEEIRGLYLAGCSRTLLIRGAEGRTADSWNQAVQSLFPRWTDLPEAMPRRTGKRERREFTAICTQSLLLALAGLLPAVLLAVMGAPTVLAWGLLAAALTVMAGGCAAARAVVRDKACKKMLLFLAAAFAPGFLAAVVMLVLTIL